VLLSLQEQEYFSLIDDMDIRDLQLFKHLAATLHFGKTSKACNITPSGLTRTIQRLENELGKPLFWRNKRSVSLTSSGKIFAKYGDEVLQLHRQLQNDLRGDDVLRGEITLYCSVTAILSILPEILERFKNLHPHTRILLQTGDAAMALEKLEREETDISIAALPNELPSHLECIKLLETPLIFIAPKANRNTVVYSDNTIDWQQTPLILAEKGLSRKRIDAWFRSHKLVPNVYSQVAGNEAIIALVSLGCGVGIVPELVLEKSTLKDSVTILENAPFLAPFSVAVCTKQKNMHNPVVKAFWQNVKDGIFSKEARR
jgi:LysR family transcriptional regulator, positive regulator for ilvC